MALTTQIQWVNRVLSTGQIISGHTYNPWWGCMKVSEECKRCYAEGIASHYGFKTTWGPTSTSTRRFFPDAHWQEPLTWNRQAERDGHRHSVFCASMADVYEENPLLIPHRERLWNLIDATPMLNWLILTKRPENILAMSPWSAPWPDNIWIGTSVGLQSRAEERIPYLLQIPAVVRFLSCEPLIGQIDLSRWISDLQWIITGGESGVDARPMNLDWARLLRQQCFEAHVPYYFKQVGGRYHNSGGSLLDGKHWRDMPPEFPVVNEVQQDYVLKWKIRGERVHTEPLKTTESLALQRFSAQKERLFPLESAVSVELFIKSESVPHRQILFTPGRRGLTQNAISNKIQPEVNHA